MFMCEEKKTGDMFAVKIMVKRVVYGAYKDLYHNEVDFMLRIHHPYIIKLYEWFEDKERIYVVQELCKYGDLYHLINQRKE